MSEHGATEEQQGSGIKVWRDTFNKVHVEMPDGRACVDAKITAPFPISAPHSCVQFENPEGKEIGTVASLDMLDESSRRVAAEELAARQYVTRVDAILSVKSAHGLTTWELETERGRRTIFVGDREDIRRLPGGRFLFTDAHGMRFEIPDTAKLDQRSQELLETET